MSPPLDCEVNRAKDCGSFIRLHNPLNSPVCSRYSVKAGRPVLGFVGHPFVSFALLTCNMSFLLNVCDFHCILLSFDLRFLMKRQRSHQLMPGLQKSQHVSGSAESLPPIAGFAPHIHTPPLCSTFIPSSHFPFGVHVKVRKLHLTTIFVLAKYYAEPSCHSHSILKKVVRT